MEEEARALLRGSLYTCKLLGSVQVGSYEDVMQALRAQTRTVQEKVISDAFKQGVMGATDDKDIVLFKHASVLHLVVTVRDLLLTCNLTTALGYLSKAKDRYKDFVGSSLDNLCRLLTIVQLAWKKKLEASPKITELQHQMVRCMQSKTNEQNKVVIVTRMDYGDETAALIDAISTVQGLDVAYVNSEKKGALLESKNIIKEVSPDDFGHILLEVQIPYVFLTSEGLLNTPEILQLLESK
ncbi:UNVERIFIED_CONTAM: hypothetical protein K2H54_035978 [Gekko kuhli]